MTFGKTLTKFSFSSTVGLPENKKTDRITWSSNSKHQRKRKESTGNVKTNYKNLLWHNSVHRSSPIHAKDSRAVKIPMFTGHTKTHVRNLQFFYMHYPTSGTKTTRNNNRIKKPDKNKSNSHGKNTKDNIQILTF